MGGAAIRKNAYLVKIGQKQYYTAHGCLFPQLGRRKIGQEIWVFRNERYGREVFRCQDCRIELRRWPFWQRRSSFSGWGCRNDLL